MPLKWCKGEYMTSCEDVHFMFAYLLSPFWDMCPKGVLSVQSGVAV